MGISIVEQSQAAIDENKTELKGDVDAERVRSGRPVVPSTTLLVFNYEG
jgi:hypothetical protein